MRKNYQKISMPDLNGILGDNEMLKYFDYKVPGGKLLRLKLEIDKNVIRDIQINGDFFLFPSEAQMWMEDSLRGLPLEKSVLRKSLVSVIERRSIKMIGLDVDSLISSIFLARKGGDK